MNLVLITIASMALVACNNKPQNGHGEHGHTLMKDQQYSMGLEGIVEHQKQELKMSAQNESSNYADGDMVPSKQLCMVNDAYMAKDQIPVPVNGKTYYGCCQTCVKTLNEQESARIVSDPQTGENVDKTEANIVLLDNEGTVAYFKNKANATDYAKNRN